MTAKDVMVRVDSESAQRADKLLKEMAKKPDFKAFQISRAAVLRIAMLRGLESLEEEFLPQRSRKIRRG